MSHGITSATIAGGSAGVVVTAAAPSPEDAPPAPPAHLTWREKVREEKQALAAENDKLDDSGSSCDDTESCDSTKTEAQATAPKLSCKDVRLNIGVLEDKIAGWKQVLRLNRDVRRTAKAHSALASGTPPAPALHGHGQAAEPNSSALKGGAKGKGPAAPAAGSGSGGEEQGQGKAKGNGMPVKGKVHAMAPWATPAAEAAGAAKTW